MDNIKLALHVHVTILSQIPRRSIDMSDSTPPPSTSRGPPKKCHSFDSKFWASSSTSQPPSSNSPSSASFLPGVPSGGSHVGREKEAATTGSICFTCSRSCQLSDTKIICAKERYPGEANVS